VIVQCIDNMFYSLIARHKIFKLFSGWNNKTRQIVFITRLIHRRSPASDRGALAGDRLWISLLGRLR